MFFTDADRELFLSTLTGVVTRYHWICRAYCLMANHYHLLVETPKANLSIGMRQLNGIYTQSFNRRHNRVGHLFQGRFKAILVERDSHLLELCRYIVLNPARVKSSAKASTWKWSSYRATAGLASVPEFLHTDWKNLWGQTSTNCLSRFALIRTCIMARRPRLFAAGVLYHVIVRGNQRQKTLGDIESAHDSGGLFWQRHGDTRDLARTAERSGASK